MSEMNNEFEQLLEESLVTIHNGEIVEGTVISVKEDEIIFFGGNGYHCALCIMTCNRSNGARLYRQFLTYFIGQGSRRGTGGYNIAENTLGKRKSVNYSL